MAAGIASFTVIPLRKPELHMTPSLASKLDSLTIRIEDTEKFIDEVSEVAYETAVEVVTDKVIEETHNADFDEIEKLKKTKQALLNKMFV